MYNSQSHSHKSSMICKQIWFNVMNQWKDILQCCTGQIYSFYSLTKTFQSTQEHRAAGKLLVFYFGKGDTFFCLKLSC